MRRRYTARKSCGGFVQRQAPWHNQNREREPENESEQSDGDSDQNSEDQNENMGDQNEEDENDSQEDLSPEEMAKLKRQTALDLIKSVVGANFDLTTAEKALDATEQAADGNSSEDWAEAAMIELAMQQEARQESEKMGAAMQASLEEAELRKKEQIPLVERTAQEVEAEFKSSQLLSLLKLCLGDVQSVYAILDSNKLHKNDVVDYLLMEQRCQRWYPSSRMYFMTAAEGAVKDLSFPDNDTKDDVKDDSEKRKKLKRQVDVDDHTIELINSFVSKQLVVLREEVYSKPNEGSEGGIPSLFADYKMEPEEVDVADG